MRNDRPDDKNLYHTAKQLILSKHTIRVTEASTVAIRSARNAARPNGGAPTSRKGQSPTSKNKTRTPQRRRQCLRCSKHRVGERFLSAPPPAGPLDEVVPDLPR